MNALIVMEPREGLNELLGRLRSLGVSPIVGLNLEQAARFLTTFRPDLAIVGHGGGSSALLRRLEERGVPIVLMDESNALAHEHALRLVVAALLSPVKADLQPKVLDLTDETTDRAESGKVVKAGRLLVDRVGRVAFLDGERVELPPMEFALLLELALHPGEPIAADALRRRLWPPDGPATNEDVHRHVYRLRKLIGDRDRPRPLITNRRGFGYVLEVSEPAPSAARTAGAVPADDEAASGE